MVASSEVLVVLGPLAQIMPRVFLVMMSAATALIAAAYVGRAMRTTRLLQMILGWYLACVAGGVAYFGVCSLVAYGSPASRRPATFVEPLTLEGAGLALLNHVVLCMGLLTACPMLAALILRTRNAADVSAERVLLETHRS